MHRFLVYPQHSGYRIDKALAETVGISRRLARRLLVGGAVVRNGRPCRVQSRVVEAGDVLDVLEPPEDGQPGPTPPQVVIRHQDSWVLVVDKPFGVLSQPGERPSPRDLAMDQQLLLFLAHREGRRPFIRLIHRLDRVTSGLLLFARVPQSLKPLSRIWSEGQVERRYLAVVEGRPGFQRVSVQEPLARVPGGQWRFQVSAHGKMARTDVEVLSHQDGITLVECRLQTGRTHQVRVHLAHAGFPVAGDKLYGATHPGFPRPLLHAALLELPHPRGGGRLRVEAPMPQDMAHALDSHRP